MRTARISAITLPLLLVAPALWADNATGDRSENKGGSVGSMTTGSSPAAGTAGVQPSASTVDTERSQGALSGDPGTYGRDDAASATKSPSAMGTDPAAEDRVNTDTSGDRLPGTASPLPLLGLSGLASLAGALALRLRRR